MDIRHMRIENLERMLVELLEIQAVASGAPSGRLHLWLDLAITETRSQIARARAQTVH